MNRQILLGTFAALALLASSPSAWAGDITYNVDLTIGTGTVVGTIITDGTAGNLAGNYIIGGSLTITGLGTSYVANLPNSLYHYSGDDLIATDDNILFNFSGTDMGGLAVGSMSKDFYWNLGTSGYIYGGDPSYPGMDIFLDNGGQTDTPTMSGEVVIASVSTVTPEPGTLNLMILGVLELGLLVRFKSSRKNLPATTAW